MNIKRGFENDDFKVFLFYLSFILYKKVIETLLLPHLLEIYKISWEYSVCFGSFKMTHCAMTKYAHCRLLTHVQYKYCIHYLFTKQAMMASLSSVKFLQACGKNLSLGDLCCFPMFLSS